MKTEATTPPRPAWPAAACLILLWAAPANGQPPVACRFDIDAVTAPAARVAVAHRLRATLDHDLRGGSASVATLHLTAQLRRGRLLGQVELAFGKAAPVLLARRTLRNVDELAELANEQVRRRRIWLARLESALPGSNGKRWRARPLLSAKAPTNVLKSPDGRSLWKITAPTGDDGLCTVEKLSGPAARDGGILVHRPGPGATAAKLVVALRVVNSDNVPLQAMEVYVKAGAFPDQGALRIRQEKLIGKTGRSGRLRFAWDQAELPYLLIARNQVPLVALVVAPGSGAREKVIRIQRLWPLKRQGQPDKMAGLDEYVIAMRTRIDRAVALHNLRLKVLAQARKLLGEGNLRAAENAIRQLPAGDSVRQEVEGRIQLAKTKGEVEKLLYRALLAEKVKDYDTAVTFARRAVAAAAGADKPKLQARLAQLQADAAKLEKQVAPAASRLGGLGIKNAADLVAGVDEIESAVDALCGAAQVSSLVAAAKSLDAALDVQNRTILSDVEKIRAGTKAKDDPLFLKLGKTSKRFIRCRERIAATLERVQLPE